MQASNFLGVLISNSVSGVSAEQPEAKPVWRKPPPEGVVEIVGTDVSSLVELTDGSLLAQNGSVSSDGGKNVGRAALIRRRGRRKRVDLPQFRGNSSDER